MDLNTATERFEHVLHGRDAGRAEQTAARAGISAALESGLAAVQSLDVIVANCLRGDAVMMAVTSHHDVHVASEPERIGWTVQRREDAVEG